MSFSSETGAPETFAKSRGDRVGSDTGVLAGLIFVAWGPFVKVATTVRAGTFEWIGGTTAAPRALVAADECAAPHGRKGALTTLAGGFHFKHGGLLFFWWRVVGILLD